MTVYLNRVVIQAAGNGTTSHTINPASSGTVVAGSAFTPTAGRFLLCVAEGPVTSTTPSGWTLPTGGSAVNNSGLYVWYKTAAGSDTLTTTHNASNNPVGFAIYEFAAGTTFVQAASATGITAAAGPGLTGLTGVNVGVGTRGWTNNSTTLTVSGSITPTTDIEDVDTSVVNASAIDGYWLHVLFRDSVSASTYTPATVTVSNPPSASGEGVTLALNVPMVSFRSISAFASNTATVSKPTGTAVGDLLCIFWHSDTTSDLPSLAGWNNSIHGLINSSNNELGVLWKIATATEVAASTFTVGGTFTTGAYTELYCAAYYNPDGTTPVSASSVVDGFTTDNLTIAATNELEIAAVSFNFGDTTALPPAGWITEASTSGGNNFYIAHRTWGPTGTTGTQSFSGQGSTGGGGGVVHLVLQPPASVTVPGTPTSPAVTPGYLQHIVTWTAPASDGGSPITGYQVEFSTNGGGSWSNASANTGSSATTYTHSSLTIGTNYRYRISAINSVGTGTASSATGDFQVLDPVFILVLEDGTSPLVLEDGTSPLVGEG